MQKAVQAKQLLALALVFMVSWSFSQAASASLYLTPGGLGAGTAMTLADALGQLTQGNENNQNDIDDALEDFFDPDPVPGELYKSEVDGGTEFGSAAGWYTTTYDLTPSDPSKFTIEWDGGSFIGGATHLLVKDGSKTPAWYLFDITGLWDGMDDIIGFDFWPGGGAVSHVTIYGSVLPPPPPPPPPPGGGVPEPTALIVWSLLIGGTGWAARRGR